jgi:hypothetical protein
MTRCGLLAASLAFAAVTATTASAQQLSSATEPATAPVSQQSAPEATPAPKEPDPFTHLLQNFYRDVKHLPSLDNAITLGVGGGLALAVHPVDDEVTEHATEGGPRQPYTFGSALGDGWVQVGFAVGTYATGLIAHQSTVTHFGSDLVRAQALNAVLTQGVKFAVRRDRPGNPEGTSYSMPSGHTSSAFATAAVVWRHFGWKAGVPASAVGAWVGAGRVQLGKHFLSDVVFGAAVGTLSGRTVTVGHGRKQIVVTLAVVPGGAAAVFTVVER